MFRQITIVKVFRVPKQCAGIFEVSNAWINVWSNMMEEKAGSRSRIQKKGSKRMSKPGALREFFWFWIPAPVRI